MHFRSLSQHQGSSSGGERMVLNTRFIFKESLFPGHNPPSCKDNLSLELAENTTDVLLGLATNIHYNLH